MENPPNEFSGLLVFFLGGVGFLFKLLIFIYLFFNIIVFILIFLGRIDREKAGKGDLQRFLS